MLIETPKGSRNKYAYDENYGLLSLKKVLPSGMAFPFDFGCIPGTRGEDGDPLDVLVLLEETVCSLCVVQASLIGVIEAVQIENGERERNDRLVAMAKYENKPAEFESIKKMDGKTLKEIERFFISYNDLEGRKFKVLDYSGPNAAIKKVKEGAKVYKREE